MIASFSQLEQGLKSCKPFRLAVAGAADREVLAAVKMGRDRGLIEPLLVGDAGAVSALAREAGLADAPIIQAESTVEAAETAAFLVQSGEAEILMKGMVDTTAYMRAVLYREKGLRGQRLLSALSVYQVPGYHKLIFTSDSGIVTAPDLEQKLALMDNALEMMAGCGYTRPKTAFLAASEVVNPKVPATADAARLAEMTASGLTRPCLAEGPLALDVIFDPQAARHKGIASEVSGDVDLIIYPNIESGNALGKCWLHFSKALWGGLVLGCRRPVVLGSRSDTPEVKINSILLGCHAAQAMRAIA